ncbi:MAG: 2-phospho-L-lactate guanylyltransferase [Thermoleophilaceae bacterium]
MKTLAILPVKSFGAAKQRLASALSPGARRELARAMFADVLDALLEVPDLDEIAVVAADREAASAITPATHGAPVRRLSDTEQAGQSAAALIGIRHALEHGFERVLLVPGDTPLIDPAEVAALLARAAPVAVVPDRHGTGTNALVLSPPDAIEPSFGPGSRARHEAAAATAGVPDPVEEVPTLMLDVDTVDDLAALEAALEAHPRHAPATRKTLQAALSCLDPA